ncbi:MAG: hypothetical protein RJA98_2101, partial [Pseudomonadota bacterium]
FPTYDVGGTYISSWSYNDLVKGNYAVINMGHKDPGHFIHSYTSPDGIPGMELTPQAVANGSVR